MTIPQTFFVSEELQVRDVKLSDGSIHQIHFKELPALDFRRWHENEKSEDPNIRLEAITKLLVLGVYNEDGTPGFTLEQARKLKGGAMAAIFEALLDVNGASTKKQEKLGND
jgi:hypothetical protein